MELGFFLRLSVFLFLPHKISITNAARTIELDTEMFQPKFWKPIYLGVKSSRSRVTKTLPLAPLRVRASSSYWLLGRVTVFMQANHLGMLPATPDNSASYPQRDGKWIPAKGLRSSAAKGRYGSFHLWINVAGKTVWSSVYTCHIYPSALEISSS